MPRRREGDGWVREIKGYLYGYYNTYVLDLATGQARRKQESLPLGPKSKTRMWEARKKLKEHILRETGGNDARQRNGNVSFGWFLEKRFIPMKESGWRAESTMKTNLWLLNGYLKKSFGDKLLKDLNKFELQVWLNDLAKKSSDGVVKHCKHFLKAILEEAVEQDLIAKNPAQKLELPKNRRPVDKTVLEWRDIWRVLSHLSKEEMHRLLFQVSMVDGLRPGEIIALRWRCLQPNRLIISQTVYRGALRDYGKTKKSTTGVPIPDGLYRDVLSWRERCPDPSPDALIFPNQDAGFLNTSNYLNRIFYPLREELGLKKLNFQVLRRSFSTRAQEHGTAKDRQGVLRHTTVDTTEKEYTMVIDERAQKLVEAMYEMLMKGGVKGEVRGKLQ